jgi:UDP-N-acetyl-2-amino-2-deoxyglucuronate dehydrogenase
MTAFGLIGAAGYIAPRHMQAISDSGHQLAIAADSSDSVGTLDRWFPAAEFVTHERDFFSSVASLSKRSRPVVSICTPSDLHAAHSLAALAAGADVICEKPLVLDPADLDRLAAAERATGRRVASILQLRLHPQLRELRTRIAAMPATHVADVDLAYITARGPWYHVSWKGDEARSGGIVVNIGIHLFDLLCHLFGPPAGSVVHERTDSRAAGFLDFPRARVRWFLSVDEADLPEAVRLAGKRAYRRLVIDGEEAEFSDGFADLHTECYREILAGGGPGIEENRPAVELSHAIRTAPIAARVGDYHPLLIAAGRS